MSASIRTAIVEDDDELRELIRRRLERSGDMQVVRTFSSGDDFLDTMDSLDLHVVLMDINMPGRNGIETVRAAKQRKPGVQYLMLTIFENPFARVRVVGETRIEPCDGDRPRPPRRSGCVTFGQLETGTPVPRQTEVDDAVVESNEDSTIDTVGGVTGLLVAGRAQIKFPEPWTDVKVVLLAPGDTRVEGRAGDALVTTVDVTASDSVQTAPVDAMELTEIVVHGERVVLVEVCGRRLSERDLIY